MRTIQRNAMHRKRWLISAACAALVAACGAPQAWNDYLGSGYYRGDASRVPTLSIPAEVSGTVGDISTDELRSIVAEKMHVTTTARANAGALSQEGSSSQGVAPTRIAWTFTGTPTAGGAKTDVHANARYYSDNVLISSAEGTAVIANGPNDPRLGELVAAVASQLFPTTPRGGPGRR